MAIPPSNIDIVLRSEFPLFAPYLEWLRAGSKTTTIRYRPGAVEVPSTFRLPLYATRDLGPPNTERPDEIVDIIGVDYCQFSQLTPDHAADDGFGDLPQLRKALTAIYPRLAEDGDQWVTIYSIRLVR